MPALAVGHFGCERNHETSFGGFFTAVKQRFHFSAKPGHPAESGRGQVHNLLEQAGGGGEKFEHLLEPLPAVGAARIRLFQFIDAFLQNAQGGIDFAAFPLLGDDPEDLPDVLDGLEMITAVAENVYHADDAPALEFAQAGAHVGASDRQSGGDVLGMQRFRREEEQGMYLGHGAIDSPAGSHLAPVEHEFLFGRRKRRHDYLLFLYKQKLLEKPAQVNRRFSRLLKGTGLARGLASGGATGGALAEQVLFAGVAGEGGS